MPNKIAATCFIFLIASIIAKNTSAQICSEPGTVIVFANGVNTPVSDAKMATEKLRDNFKAFREGTSAAAECLEFKYAYNTNEKAFVDFFEASNQSLQDFSSGFWLFFANIDAAPDWFQNLASESAASVDAASYVFDGDLREHVSLYRDAIGRGQRILVVSHSQGNFYANEAYKVLYENLDNQGALQTRSYGIVAVATPASFVGGDGPYTTKRGDFIWTVPLFLAPLPFNLIEACGGPVACHAFVKSYLSGSISGPRIMGHILAVLLSLERPPVQHFTWSLKSPAATPPVRYKHAMAYDAAGGEVVLFGGLDGVQNLNDTWVWDGTDWMQKSPAHSPGVRAEHAMAYDAARGEVVLFAGVPDFGMPNETWVWDGTDWMQKSPAHSPGVRAQHTMTYDAARGEVVLFGGFHNAFDAFGNLMFLNDTWVWDGTDWMQKIPAHSPEVRWGHAMAYDAARGEVVLFGGLDIGFGRLNDTWVWDGTDWMQKSPAHSPGVRAEHAMAYDAARGEVVLFAGVPDFGMPNETWVWDGTDWMQKNPVTSPSFRWGHAMTYDVARGEVVLFGGGTQTGGNFTLLDDTWTFEEAQ